jgi:hypothetical protein
MEGNVSMNEEDKPQKPLGLVELPEHTLDLDMKLMERYQNFSAELLRIALLGITAIGFVASRTLSLARTEERIPPLPQHPKLLLIGALILLAISAGAALVHRYFSADSMACHIKAMRHYTRTPRSPAQASVPDSAHSFWKTVGRMWKGSQSSSTESDGVLRRRETGYRNDALLWSARALLISTASLAIGAFFLAVSIVLAMP